MNNNVDVSHVRCVRTGSKHNTRGGHAGSQRPRQRRICAHTHLLQIPSDDAVRGTSSLRVVVVAANIIIILIIVTDAVVGTAVWIAD